MKHFGFCLFFGKAEIFQKIASVFLSEIFNNQLIYIASYSKLYCKAFTEK